MKGLSYLSILALDAVTGKWEVPSYSIPSMQLAKCDKKRHANEHRKVGMRQLWETLHKFIGCMMHLQRGRRNADSSPVNNDWKLIVGFFPWELCITPPLVCLQ
jgi:hypothetical protein